MEVRMNTMKLGRCIFGGARENMRKISERSERKEGRCSPLERIDDRRNRNTNNIHA
jgi:hypothetical protein